MIKKKIILILILTLYSPGVLFAGFINRGTGARPLGMGNAFVAIADDANAIVYNPAGLGKLEQEEFTAMYANMYPGILGFGCISDGYIGYVYPISKEHGTVGLSWFNFSALELYQENTITISYGKQLFDELSWARGVLSCGLNLKYLSKMYGRTDFTGQNPVFQKKGNFADGYTCDFGILYMPQMAERISIGLSLENLTQPDISLYTPDKVLQSYRVGIGFEQPELMTAALDIFSRGSDYKLLAGTEGKLFEGKLAARVGFGFGSNDYMRFSIGAGYSFVMRRLTTQIDFAYIYPFGFIENNGGDQRISVTMRF